MKLLSRADEILMIAIACLGEDAYSTTLLEELAHRGGKKVTVGSLWVSLDQLAEKGLIRKRSAPNTSRRGGRPRIYYRLSPRGVRLLLRMRDFQSRLWDGIPDLETYSVK
jgi:PadR family transcriptional regulator PadR